MVLGRRCFGVAIEEDILYKYIYKKNRKKYFEELSTRYSESKFLSDEFKDLLYRVISFEENDRPNNIAEILSDSWLKETRNPSDEKKLEEEVKAKFIEKEDFIKEQLKLNPKLFVE